MTTSTQTYRCAICGRELPPSELFQDTYSGFLVCKDSGDCEKATERQDKAYEAAKSRNNS
jgi:DNA-directed RNA polymerase subunit RPC12/RpoP